jgi:hypothetical protein
MPQPLALTDFQISMLKQAANTLPVSGRDDFLRGVASHLGSDPSDDAVRRAIDNQLAVNENHLVISITYEFAVLFRMARHFLPAAVARLSCVECAYYGVGRTF